MQVSGLRIMDRQSQHLEGAGGTPETIEVLDETKGTVVFQTGDLKVTAFLVDHRPVEPAFGYRFDYKGRSVVISGDTLPCESLRRQAEGVDLLLHEALQPEMLRIINQAGITSGRKVVAKVTTDILTYHTFPEEAARIARDANVRHLVLFHIIPPTPMAFFNSAFLGDSREVLPWAYHRWSGWHAVQYASQFDKNTEEMAFAMNL